MATAFGDGQVRDVTIGRALNGGFGTVGSNPVTAFGIAFLFGALPVSLINYFAQIARPVVIERAGLGGQFGLTVATSLLGIVFSSLSHGALVRVTLAYSEGRRAGFREALNAAIAIFGPLVLLSFLMAFGIGIGTILLIVPGILLYLMWCVAAPAMVAERLGISAAFARSAYLTKGARWKVLGLITLMLIFSSMCGGLLGTAGASVYGGVKEFAAVIEHGLPAWYIATGAVVQTLVAAVWGSIQASLYIELRNWKDGPPSDALADIFA